MIISAGRRGDQRATLHDQIWRPSMRFERPLARFTAIVPIPCSSSIFDVFAPLSRFSVFLVFLLPVFLLKRVCIYIYITYIFATATFDTR